VNNLAIGIDHHDFLGISIFGQTLHDSSKVMIAALEHGNFQLMSEDPAHVRRGILHCFEQLASMVAQKQHEEGNPYQEKHRDKSRYDLEAETMPQGDSRRPHNHSRPDVLMN